MQLFGVYAEKFGIGPGCIWGRRADYWLDSERDAGNDWCGGDLDELCDVEGVDLRLSAQGWLYRWSV